MDGVWSGGMRSRKLTFWCQNKPEQREVFITHAGVSKESWARVSPYRFIYSVWVSDLQAVCSGATGANTSPFRRRPLPGDAAQTVGLSDGALGGTRRPDIWVWPIEQDCGCDSGVSTVEYFTELTELWLAGAGEGHSWHEDVGRIQKWFSTGNLRDCLIHQRSGRLNQTLVCG